MKGVFRNCINEKVVVYFTEKIKPFGFTIIYLLRSFGVGVHAFMYVPAVAHNGVRGRKQRRK